MTVARGTSARSASSDTSMNALFPKQKFGQICEISCGRVDTATILLRVRDSRDTDERTGPAGEGLSTYVVGAAPLGGGAAHSISPRRSPRIGSSSTRLPRVPPARDPVDDVSAHMVVDARDALDALPDGVVIADEDGVVTPASTTAAARAARPTREAAVGRPLADVSRAPTRRAAAGSPAPARTTGWPRAPASPSSRGSCPTATRCWSPPASTATPRTRPVTEVAVSLRSGRARARLDRERSDLVATVAHELRSPLTGVKGFVAKRSSTVGQAQRRAEEADARDGPRRRRPAEPADHRAARRGPASTPAGSRCTSDPATYAC